MRKKIIVIGGVGTGTVIAATIEDIMRESQEWELYGFLNDSMKAGDKLNGFPVLGKSADAGRFDAEGCYFIYALVTAKKAYERVEKLHSLGIPGEKFPALKHPTAVVSRNVRLGCGVVLMPGVVISPDVVIGNHTHLYANSFIGHNSELKDYCLVANNASIGSFVLAEQGVHVGSNSSILEHVILGEWSIVGLGAVVLKDVQPYWVVAGNPASRITPSKPLQSKP